MPSLPWDELEEHPEDYIQSTILPGNIRHPTALSVPDFFSIMNAIRDASESANDAPFIVFRPKAIIEQSRLARTAANSEQLAPHRSKSASPDPFFSSSPPQNPSPPPPALPQAEPPRSLSIPSRPRTPGPPLNLSPPPALPQAQLPRSLSTPSRPGKRTSSNGQLDDNLSPSPQKKSKQTR